MYTKIPTKDMGREEWLQLRKTGLGGSDAGAVCGQNPYSSPMTVYRDKTMDGLPEKPEKEAVRQGRELEEYVAQRFTDATGLKVRRSNYLYRSAAYPFMIADVDRLIVGEDAGLECKTVSPYSADQWKDGEVPPHYLQQCYHYMAVTGRRTWYIAAVVLGQEFLYRKIAWDGKRIQELIKKEQDFWKNHVEKRVLPPPDGSKACGEALGEYFPVARQGSVLELRGFDGMLERREEILEEIAGLQTEQERIEQEVKLAMKEHEQAKSGSYKISWSNVQASRLDTRRIRAERPEIYRDYAKVSVSRRFQVKAA